MSYNDLYEAYKRCFGSEFSGKKIQDDVNVLWKKLKNDSKNFPKNVEEKVKELKKSATVKKAGLMSYFTKVIIIILCIVNYVQFRLQRI